jgi:hypothetical protein
VPYASNSRTHTPAQLEKLARSLKEFGFTNPILLDGENGIIAGHARLQAAQKIGLSEVPTIDLSWLTPTQRQAYVIADNQLATDAGWDAEMLRLELGDLKELGFDLALTGFDEIELGTFLADKTEGLTDPDDVPQVPEHPVTQPGDLWLLGRHRLLCGDSTVATDVERVLGGTVPTVLFVDPPYGMNLDTNYHRSNRVYGNTYSPVIGDDADFDPAPMLAMFSQTRESFLWGADYYRSRLPPGGSWLVWDKKQDNLDASSTSGWRASCATPSHCRRAPSRIRSTVRPRRPHKR